MKAEIFPCERPSDWGFPPGFLAVKLTREKGSSCGVMPDEKGNCRWVRVMKGRQSDETPAAWGELWEKEAKATQRLWLRYLRLVDLKSAEGIEAEIGVSTKTWQGWEGGKAIPYFRAARLLLIQWEKSRAQPIKRGW